MVSVAQAQGWLGDSSRGLWPPQGSGAEHPSPGSGGPMSLPVHPRGHRAPPGRAFLLQRQVVLVSVREQAGWSGPRVE